MESPTKKAVLLAAGTGSRLGSYTADIPKCMIKVGRYRLLGLLLRNLEAAGVTALVVVTGYQHKVLEHYLGRFETSITVTTIYCPDYATTNNIVSLWRARDGIDSDFLLLESDLILSPQMLMRMSPGNCAAVSPYQNWMNGTVVSVDSEGRVEGMYLRDDPQPDRPMYKTVNLSGVNFQDWKNLIWPALDAKVRAGETGGYYEQVFADKLSEGGLNMRAAIFDSNDWFEVDTPEDLRQAEELLPRFIF